MLLDPRKTSGWLVITTGMKPRLRSSLNALSTPGKGSISEIEVGGTGTPFCSKLFINVPSLSRNTALWNSK